MGNVICVLLLVIGTGLHALSLLELRYQAPEDRSRREVLRARAITVGLIVAWVLQLADWLLLGGA